MEDKLYELVEKMYVEMQKGFNQVDKKIEQTNKRIDNLENGVNDINKTVLKIEQNHGEQLFAFFDGHGSITQTLADHTDRLQRIEEKSETHD